MSAHVKAKASVGRALLSRRGWTRDAVALGNPSRAKDRRACLETSDLVQWPVFFAGLAVVAALLVVVSRLPTTPTQAVSPLQITAAFIGLAVAIYTFWIKLWPRDKR
jgi:hypothetical protein